MSSQHSSKGRRTPLTLGQQQSQPASVAAHHKSSSGGGGGRKGSTNSDANNSATDQATAISIEQLKQKASIDMAAATALVGPKSVKENALQKAAAAQEAADAAAAVARAAAAASADVIVIDDADESNGSAGSATVKSKRVAKREAKEAKAAAAAQPQNGNGKAQAAVEEAAVVVQSQSSPRAKKTASQTDKEAAEEKELEAVLVEFEAQDATAAAGTPEKGRRKLAATTPAKSTPIATTPTKQRSGASSKTTTPAKAISVCESLEDDVVMETLAIDSDATESDSPASGDAPLVATAQSDGPPASAAAPSSPKSVGKVFKYSVSPAPQSSTASTASTASIRSRLSPFATRRRSIEEATAAAPSATATADGLANLSTVSERSNESRAASFQSGSPAVEAATATDGGHRLFGSLRHITGRRSTRPLRELALQHNMAAAQHSGDVYRRTRTELDDETSFGSMNATAGSEIDGAEESGDEELPALAPAVAAAAESSASRKRTQLMAGGASEPDLHTASLLESPKRPRLDLSGFLGMMASPVTLLRNKFARSSLLSSSTPNRVKKLDVDAEEEEATALVDLVSTEDGEAELVDVEKVSEGAECNSSRQSGGEEMEVVLEQTDVEAEVAETAVIDGGDAVIGEEGEEKAAIDAIVVEGEAVAAAEPALGKRNKYSCSIM